MFTLCLHLPISQGHEAIAQTKGVDLTGYPATPEGVVEAFCIEDFKGSGLTPSTWGKLLKYTTFKKLFVRIDSVVVSKYKVTKVSRTSQKAKVKVEYDVAGEIFEHPAGWELKNPNKIGEVFVVSLVKIDGYWKIDEPSELVLSRHISIEVAIQRLERPLESGFSSDHRELEYRRKIVRVFEKHKENPSNFIPYILSSLGIQLKIYKKTFFPIKETLKNYPGSPDKVVEAYLKEGFDINIGYDKREIYTLHGISPYGSTTVLVLDCRMSVIKGTSDTAWVKVEYKVGGYFERGEHGISFRTMDKTDEIYIFELVKHEGLWQIKSPSDHQYELVQTKMKELEGYVALGRYASQAKGIMDALIILENKTLKGGERW